MNVKKTETPAEEIICCEKCKKTPEICVCDSIKPVKNKLKVLILQHPQEPDKDLGSANLAHLVLENSVIKIGLSWPNLAKALGVAQASPSEWIVLFLGTKSHAEIKAAAEDKIVIFDKKDKPSIRQHEVISALKGIVVIDGSWAQAKTMWWRNPWLLKLQRAILIPKAKSLYGSLRKEPRKECISTLESIAIALSACGEPANTNAELMRVFELFLSKFKTK